MVIFFIEEKKKRSKKKIVKLYHTFSFLYEQWKTLLSEFLFYMSKKRMLIRESNLSLP